jgi:hypothetical protein
MPDIFKASAPLGKMLTEDKPPVKKSSTHSFDYGDKSIGGTFSSFIYLPKSVKFVAKESSEEIILLLRRHPLTNFGWIIVTVFLLLAPMILSFFPILSFLPENYKFVAILLWYAITIAYALESFLNWFFNVCVATNETVFDVDFTNLIYREISEADLDHIQDVTVRMGGVVRTMFDYGDVFIQTAGEVPRIEFEAVPHPDKVAKIVRELCFKEEGEHSGV